MPPVDRTAWQRLGPMLAKRRAEISPRYANRRAFADDREMNWRTLHDIEAAKRDNFRPETMRAFEVAYMLAPGSLDRTLAGGPLEPLPAAGQHAPLRPVPSPPESGSPAIGVLLALLARRPHDDELAAEVIPGLLSLLPGDTVVAAIAGQPKAPSMIGREIREWLAIDHGGGMENGGSAGLPFGNSSGIAKNAYGHGRTSVCRCKHGSAPADRTRSLSPHGNGRPAHGWEASTPQGGGEEHCHDQPCPETG